MIRDRTTRFYRFAPGERSSDFHRPYQSDEYQSPDETRPRRRRRSKTPFESEEFLALRKEWYDKLKASGFKDIENTNWKTGESMECLNGMSQMDLCRSYTPEQQRYFELAVQWDHTLETAPDQWEEYRNGGWVKNVGRHPLVGELKQDLRIVRKVWKLWANGKTMRAIERLLKIPRPTISEIVHFQERLMLQNASKDDDLSELPEDLRELRNQEGVSLLVQDSEGGKGGAVLGAPELPPTLEKADSVGAMADGPMEPGGVGSRGK